MALGIIRTNGAFHLGAYLINRGYASTYSIIFYMEPTSFFLGSLLTFLLGYLFGHRDLRQEKLLMSIRDFKKDISTAFTGREKVVILNSKDAYLPDEEEEKND